MPLEIFAVIAPVFLCSVLGYGWVRLGHAFDTPFVSQLVTAIGAPCLIFSTFMKVDIDLAAFKTMAGAALLSMGLFALIGTAVLKAARLDLRAFLASQIFPNVGNMGLPLCLLAFGNEGLALALMYFMVNVFFNFTVGPALASGRLSLGDLLRNPMFHAVWITLTFVLTDTKPPAWVQSTADLLAGFTIPLMLLALGVSLGRLRIQSLKRSLALSVLRLGMGFVVGVAVAELMGMEGTARGILILQSAMPVAVFSYLFAVRYDRQPEEVAGTVVLSTLLSFLSLPLLLWYVLPAA
jgi:predicted permease